MNKKTPPCDPTLRRRNLFHLSCRLCVLQLMLDKEEQLKKHKNINNICLQTAQLYWGLLKQLDTSQDAVIRSPPSCLLALIYVCMYHSNTHRVSAAVCCLVRRVRQVPHPVPWTFHTGTGIMSDVPSQDCLEFRSYRTETDNYLHFTFPRSQSDGVKTEANFNSLTMVDKRPALVHESLPSSTLMSLLVTDRSTEQTATLVTSHNCQQQ